MTSGAPLIEDRLRQVDARWRAANYLSAGQLCLTDNPLLREALRSEHVKSRLLGHWGATPALNFVHAHLDRATHAHGLDMLVVTGPGSARPALLANSWLDGTYSQEYPEVPRHAEGMRALFRQYGFPGAVAGHTAAGVPGTIHDGTEPGSALAHAFGAALDNPDLVVACVIGDAEAETGPLSASWHANTFLHPVHDGVVLPILLLDADRSAEPAVLSRIPPAELNALLRGLGYRPHHVDGLDPQRLHLRMARVLDLVLAETRRAKRPSPSRPRWPVIVLRAPADWVAPSDVDGSPSGARLRLLESWLRSFRPEELFDEYGTPRMRATAATAHADGGALLRPLRLPAVEEFGVPVGEPGATCSEPTRVLGTWLRDVLRRNADRGNFRMFGSGRTAANRLDAVYDVTGNQWLAASSPADPRLARSGRVIESRSAHLSQGLLEGYLLTGRHGLSTGDEAAAGAAGSMVDQHARWLSDSRRLAWRRPIASLNLLLSSHVWEPDRAGHPDPGFADRVLAAHDTVARVYLPPDGNTLLAVAHECLRGTDRINLIVTGRTSTPDWLDPRAARLHCALGAAIWDWAGSGDGEPDVVLGCAGDVPTVEVLAAAALLREHLPALGVRVVNVVDLVRLRLMPDAEFDGLFPADKPVVFAYHGNPWLIHRLVRGRRDEHDLLVRGFSDAAVPTTPFDLLVRNDLDRFQLVIDVLDRSGDLGVRGTALRVQMHDHRQRHHEWVRAHGEDLPEVRQWRWTPARRAAGSRSRQPRFPVGGGIV